jgi:hypothetical protein
MCFQKSYTHSVVYNCECKPYARRKPARLIENFSEDDLECLLEREPVVEYKYFRNMFGTLTVVKRTHCPWCKYKYEF